MITKSERGRQGQVMPACLVSQSVELDPTDRWSLYYQHWTTTTTTQNGQCLFITSMADADADADSCPVCLLCLMLMPSSSSFLLFQAEWPLLSLSLFLFPSPFADCFRIVHGNDKQQQQFSLLQFSVLDADCAKWSKSEWANECVCVCRLFSSSTRSISGIINVPLPNRLVTLVCLTGRADWTNQKTERKKTRADLYSFQQFRPEQFRPIATPERALH